jgi:hypothetical protein
LEAFNEQLQLIHSSENPMPCQHLNELTLENLIPKPTIPSFAVKSACGTMVGGCGDDGGRGKGYGWGMDMSNDGEEDGELGGSVGVIDV